MKRWGKDWSVYRTVKEAPVTFSSSSLNNLKNGNGWDQYTKHTLPDKATLNRNLNAVRSSNVDDEGEAYDAFDAEHTHKEAIAAVEAAEVNEGKLIKYIPRVERTKAKKVVDLAIAKELSEEALATAESTAKTSAIARTGRPKYTEDLNEKLEAIKAEGKAQKLSKKVIKQVSIDFAKKYNATKKEAARQAVIASAKATKAAATPAAAVGGGGSAAAVGGGGSEGGSGLPAAAVAVAKADGASPAEIKDVRAAATAVEEGVERKTEAEVKALSEEELREYAKYLKIPANAKTTKEKLVQRITFVLEMLDEVASDEEEEE